MGARDGAVLAFKVLGLWFAASGVIGLANLPYFWQSGRAMEGQNIAVLAMAFPSMLSLVVGALIWMNSGGLATRVFGDGPAEPTSRVGIETQPLFALALAVIGVLMMVEAAPMIVYGLAMFVRSRQVGTSILGPNLEQQALIWDAAAKANFAAACTRLLIGVALLAGPARLSAAYSRLRTEFRGTLAEDVSDAANANRPAKDASDKEKAP